MKIAFVFLFFLMISSVGLCDGGSCLDENLFTSNIGSNPPSGYQQWLPFIKNLQEKNKEKFFSILLKRADFEKIYSKSNESLLLSGFYFYFTNCKSNIVSCAQSLQLHINQDPYLAKLATDAIEMLSNSCKINVYATRKLLFKRINRIEPVKFSVPNFFKAGLYEKIENIDPLILSEDKLLSLYTLSLGQLGKWRELKNLESRISPSRLVNLKRTIDFHKAIGFKNSDRYQQAIEILNEILKTAQKNEQTPWFYLELAVNYSRIGKKNEAIEALREATSNSESQDRVIQTYIDLLSISLDIREKSINADELIGSLDSMDFFDIFDFCQKQLKNSKNNNFKKVFLHCQKASKL